MTNLYTEPHAAAAAQKKEKRNRFAPLPPIIWHRRTSLTASHFSHYRTASHFSPYGSGPGLSRCLGPGECLHSFIHHTSHTTALNHTSHITVLRRTLSRIIAATSPVALSLIPGGQEHRCTASHLLTSLRLPAQWRSASFPD